MSMFDQENPIFDCGRREPMRTRTFQAKDKDGRVVTQTERVPNGKYPLVVDSAGNVVPQKGHNAISNTAAEDTYGVHIRAAKGKANAKWGTSPQVDALQCPQATEWEYRLPQAMRTGDRCASAAYLFDGALHPVSGHVPIGRDQRTGAIYFCKCIGDLVRDRQAANLVKESSADQKTTIQQAMLVNSQDVAAQLTKLLTKIDEAGGFDVVATKAKEIGEENKRK